MCGPSQAQQNLENQEASFSATLQQDYAQTFAANQEILSTLNSVLQPIVQAGPNQQGFSAQENSALNSQAINSTAQGYQQTAGALGRQENAAGGGTSFLPSGVNAQINAGVASAAQNTLSNEELGITEANYATGRQNWQNALAGEESVAAGQNPLGYAGATTNSNTAAFNEATQINQESNQEFSDILGGIVSVAAAPFTGGASLIGLAGLGGGKSSGAAPAGSFNPYGFGTGPSDGVNV